MKFRYSLVLFLVSLFICAYGATAGVFDNKIEIQCGDCPTYVGNLSNGPMPEPFVICTGYEKIYNHIVDTQYGETPGSIWKFVPGETASFTKVKEFDTHLNFNMRPVIDYSSEKLYMPHANKVYILSTKSFDVLDSILCNDWVGDIKFDDKYFYIISYNIEDTTSMYRYKRDDLSKPYDSAEVMPLCKHLVLLPNNTFAFIQEGRWKYGESYLHFYENKEEMKPMKKIYIGDTGNHLVREGDYLYATTNITMDVKIFNWKEQTLIDSIEFDVPIIDNGPRECLVMNTTNSKDYKDFDVYTTVFDGFIYHSKGTKIIDKSEDIQRKRQAIVYFDGLGMMVSNIYKRNYSAGNTCTIYRSVNGVEEAPRYEATVFPNPTSNEINMNLAGIDDGNCTIGLYDMKANLVVAANANIVNNTLRYDISKLNLSSGSYYIVVKTSDKMINSKFIVK